jgi:hypothetical protein
MKSHLLAASVLLFGLLSASALVTVEVPNSGTATLNQLSRSPVHSLSKELKPLPRQACVPRPVLRYFLRLRKAIEHHARDYKRASLIMNEAAPDDIVLGSADSPTTIIEYASMTCGHCAEFHQTILPELKQKYIDTGKVRFIMREFPHDGLSVAASMLVRCGGADRNRATMVDDLFKSRATWAAAGVDSKDELLQIAKRAGVSPEDFDRCLADRALFDEITEARQRAHNEFGVDSVPTFFVNGARLTGLHRLSEFEAMLGGSERTVANGTE